MPSYGSDAAFTAYLTSTGRTLPVGAVPAVLRVDGTLDVSALKAVDAHGGDALAFDALKIQVDEARPLERQVHLGLVQLEGPRVDLRRDRDGRLNLLPPETTAAASAPARARPPGADIFTRRLSHHRRVAIYAARVEGGRHQAPMRPPRLAGAGENSIAERRGEYPVLEL